jgi:hypothetical protein
MLRKCVIVAALIFNAPIIWQALGPQTVDVDQAAIRFLLTIPVAAVLLGFLRAATMTPPEPPPSAPVPSNAPSAKEPARAERTTVD